MLYPKVFKPLFDVSLALLVIMVLFPVFLLFTLLLFIANQGKPFFVQTRIGKNEKPFSIIKFKTMNDKKDANGVLLPDTYRLTPVGKLVRKTSIDEIPQLINILKGDMSLIGPRPLLPEYLGYYTKEEQKRHWVKPGITGLAQVNGRNFIDWDTRLQLDVDYVENISFKTDFYILLKTIKNVLTSKDVSADTTNVQPYLNKLRANKKLD